MHLRRRRAAGAAVTVTAAACVLAGTAVPAHAYCISSYRNYYKGSDMRPQSGLPSAWYTAISNSVGAWNGKSANWSIGYYGPNYSGPMRGELYYVNFASYGFNDVPGHTEPYFSGGYSYGGKVYLNSSYSLNTSGTFSQSGRQADVQTVVTHELGHIVPMFHPSACGSPFTTTEQASVMEPAWAKRWVLNSDDVAGLKAVVGG
jgi:hypothetical protein